MTMTETAKKTLTPEQKATLAAAPIFALFLEGAKEPLPVRPSLSRAGNVFFTLPGQTSKGLAMTPRAAKLPRKVEIRQVEKVKDGKGNTKIQTVEGTEPVKLTLNYGVKTDPETHKSREAVEYGPVAVVLPNGDAKMVRIIFSMRTRKVNNREEWCWNAKASFYNGGGGVQLKDDLLSWDWENED